MCHIISHIAPPYPSAKVRERIEASGRDARWEFNKAVLFGRSSHMAAACADLEAMVDAVDDFFRFLGPELKAVTGEGG